MMTDEEKTEDSGQKKRFSEADFAAARELYELGKAGIAELAAEYGVSRQTLSKRFKDAGAIKGSRAHELANAAGAAAKATTERYAENRAVWIEETRLESLKSLKHVRQVGQKILVDAVKRSPPGAPLNIATADDDFKALGRFNKILIDNFTKALEILNADQMVDENDLPVLTIEDLTDDDILQHHISTGALDEDATIEDINTD